jgi:hypothetical protein
MADHVDEFSVMTPDTRRIVKKAKRKQHCNKTVCFGGVIICSTLFLYFLYFLLLENNMLEVEFNIFNGSHVYKRNQEHNISVERRRILNNLGWHFHNIVETNQVPDGDDFAYEVNDFAYEINETDLETVHKIEWSKVMECRTHSVNKTIFDGVLRFGTFKDLTNIYNICNCKQTTVC